VRHRFGRGGGAGSGGSARLDPGGRMLCL
jgi:hypothetical protein